MFYLGAEWNHVDQIFWNFSALLLKVTNISGMFVNSNLKKLSVCTSQLVNLSIYLRVCLTDDYITKTLASTLAGSLFLVL